MVPPRKRRYVYIFIGLINHYKERCDRRSHTLHSLTKLTLVSVKFILTSVKQEASDEIKKVVSK